MFAFLDALAANNNRNWFMANRAVYEELRAQWLERLQEFINHMAATEPSLRNVAAADCAYRIYRDTRFSNDKTPYKTYFSALISPTGRHCERACWYLHVGAEICAVYGGLWMPQSTVLRKIRKAIVDNIDEFRAITEAPEIAREFPGWYGKMLKTAPKGYSRNHPDIDLLRLTEYGKQHILSRDFFRCNDWPEQAAGLAMLLKPMIDFLNYSIDE